MHSAPPGSSGSSTTRQIDHANRRCETRTATYDAQRCTKNSAPVSCRWSVLCRAFAVSDRNGPRPVQQHEFANNGSTRLLFQWWHAGHSEGSYGKGYPPGSPGDCETLEREHSL